MTGSTPPWKRRFRSAEADGGPSDGVHDDERGRKASASLEAPHLGSPPAIGMAGALERADDVSAGDVETPPARRRSTAVREGVRKSGSLAKAGLGYLADRIIEIAPRVPVRDLATLRKQFPGLTPEELADKLVAGAAKASSTVGAGVGAAAMLPVPPAMPTELAAEITGVAAIELKLIAELYEVYGVRPPGNLRERSAAYLTSWTEERDVDVKKPATLAAAFGGPMKLQLRQQIMKRMVRNLPSLMPFMVGAAVGALMNRRDTRRLAEHIRRDLRKRQVPWDELPQLPPLEKPADAIVVGELPKELGH
ncbi:hypothetical protein H1V43_13625 [Streptomyces sp. PSKA54]|uniref:EcsC family protein n=1 Tax=Streptomyces himalayensis subsp. aureolus TaxID=2758039 RepID=A0A7W2D0E7_9ACTN|nr:hypothetical protein [Streptomyces himalayensis]MBA4862413.1 hypothetical protein [Streptomyces himalayensis subsp. aureolus]